MPLVTLALLLTGCLHPQPHAASREFRFGEDTFAYPNELVWQYDWDEKGKWRGTARDPKPDYSHRCFVMAKSAKQFFMHAQFEASQPLADDLTYRRLIREVLDANPRKARQPAQRVRIPGYPNLHAFSRAQAHLLKTESGGPLQSYFQRGHWRMVFPFSRGSQARTADSWLKALEKNRPAVAHVLTFPSLRINHALLVYDVQEQADRLLFEVYDPNTPEEPCTLTYDRPTRTFHYPTTAYFPGGNVNVYEVYHRTLY